MGSIKGVDYPFSCLFMLTFASNEDPQILEGIHTEKCVDLAPQNKCGYPHFFVDPQKK